MNWRGAAGGAAVGAAGTGTYYFFGGLLMILGALGEFLVGNTFPFVVFGSFGKHYAFTILQNRPIPTNKTTHRRLLAQLRRNPPTLLQRLRRLLPLPNKSSRGYKHSSIPLLLRLLLHSHGSNVLHLHDPLPPNQHRLFHHFLHPRPRLRFPSRRLLPTLEWKSGVGRQVADSGRRFCVCYLCVWVVDFLCDYACGVGFSVSVAWYVNAPFSSHLKGLTRGLGLMKASQLVIFPASLKVLVIGRSWLNTESRLA